MVRKREGLLAVLLVLSILLLDPWSLTGAGSGSGAETPLPEPDITLFEGLGHERTAGDHLQSLGQGAFPCKKVLFLDDRGGEEFSVLKSTLVALGFEVQEGLPSEITASLIAPHDVIVFSLGWYAGGGGQRALTDAEAAALVQFVNLGKSLFLVGELGRASWSGKWRESLNRIAGNFGITFNNNMLCSSANHLSNPADPDGGVDLPIIKDISSRLLGEGVGQFSIFWGSSVGVKSPARAVARSDASSWRDTDCTWNFVINEWECAQDPDQPSGVYPVLAAAESGAGRILAIGDSSWMMNGWIDYTDNLQLAKNIFAWLARLPSVKSLTARPTSGITPLKVTFTCGIKDPGTHVSEYQWDFNGDGVTDRTTTTASTSHIYTATSTYAPTCTVVDVSGCSSTSNPGAITVSPNQQPVIDSFTAAPATGTSPLRVKFACSAHDIDGSVRDYSFHFGDGTQAQNSRKGTVNHTYKNAGIFNAICTAIDGKGGETKSKPVTVTIQTNQAPVIDSFVAEPEAGNAPIAVSFLCSAHDPDGSISYYVINFGDGNTTTSTSGDAAKIYSLSGTYNATCTAVDNRGAQTTSTPLPIAVNGLPFITSYTATEVIGVCDNATLTRPFSFTCSASDPEGSIARYEITFGDNQTTVVTTSDTTVTVQHSYLFNAGTQNTHTTQCTVYDNLGARAVSQPVTVQVHTCE
jgi:PKD repeat protein